MSEPSDPVTRRPGRGVPPPCSPVLVRSAGVAAGRTRCAAVARRAGARRAWPAAAGGGARFGARTRDAVLAPRPLPPRAPRARRASPRRASAEAARRSGDRRDDGCDFRGSDRTVCLTISPALALESTQFLYSTPANSSPEKARARSQECTSKRSRTCHPGYAVWCGKCAELRRRSAPLGEPATHMPARHAAP